MRDSDYFSVVCIMKNKNKNLHSLNIFLIEILPVFAAKRTIAHQTCIPCKSKLVCLGKAIDLFVDE